MSVISVPPITQRQRIPQEAIEDVARQIAQKFRPHAIILFGSYAYGTPKPESDLDLLVIMDTPLRETQQALIIAQSLEWDWFGLDLIVYTPKKLQQRIDLGDSFLKEIITRGKVLYEASD
ncbi:MAG: nucleotidyltransferase domain-containing protein [Anaerolineales bacterium]